MQGEAEQQAVEALLLQLYREYLILALKEKAWGEYLKKKWLILPMPLAWGNTRRPGFI